MIRSGGGGAPTIHPIVAGLLAAASGYVVLSAALATDAARHEIKKIALEEHFNAVGFEDYSKAFVKHIDSADARELMARLHDFDAQRLEEVFGA